MGIRSWEMGYYSGRKSWNLRGKSLRTFFRCHSFFRRVYIWSIFASDISCRFSASRNRHVNKWSNKMPNRKRQSMLSNMYSQQAICESFISQSGQEKKNNFRNNLRKRSDSQNFKFLDLNASEPTNFHTSGCALQRKVLIISLEWKKFGKWKSGNKVEKKMKIEYRVDYSSRSFLQEVIKKLLVSR